MNNSLMVGRKFSHQSANGQNQGTRTQSRKNRFSLKRKYPVNRDRHRVQRPDEEEFYSNYLSDSDIGETELKVFEEWSDCDEDDNVTKMIHTGWNHSIARKSWRNIKKSKNPSLFAKNLSRALWGEEIIDRATEVKDNFMKSVTGRKRTPMTPTKMKSIYQCLKYWILIFHEYWLYERDLKGILHSLDHYMAEEIQYQLRQYEERNQLNRKEKKRERLGRMFN